MPSLFYFQMISLLLIWKEFEMWSKGIRKVYKRLRKEVEESSIQIWKIFKKGSKEIQKQFDKSSNEVRKTLETKFKDLGVKWTV